MQLLAIEKRVGGGDGGGVVNDNKVNDLKNYIDQISKLLGTITCTEVLAKNCTDPENRKGFLPLLT